MSVRIEIENQMQGNICAAPLPRKLQDTMPAMLEPHMSQMAWDSFRNRANQDLDIVNNIMQKIQYFRLAMCGIPLLFFIISFASVSGSFFGSRDYDYDPDSSMGPGGGSTSPVMFMIPFIVPMVLLVLCSVGFMRWVGGKTQEALTVLRRTCSNVSQEVPGLTMHVQEEVTGYGKRRMVTYHILASVSGGTGVVTAVAPAQVFPAQVVGATAVPVTATAVGITNNSAVPNFCPNCGNPTGGANFCGKCGHNLTA